jgi:regulator of nucleoside diphosphate kinase
VVDEGVEMKVVETKRLGAHEHPDFHDGYTAIRLREMPSILRQPRRRGSIVVTTIDARRLRALVHRQRLRADGSLEAMLRTEPLEAELKHATIVDARMMPANVVTMNSSLVCEDERTGRRLFVKLVYARDAHSRDHVAVLTPLGTALLGMTVGQVVEAKAVAAAAKRLRITALPYQPERAGDYHL